jgi:hypothetical protein
MIEAEMMLSAKAEMSNTDMRVVRELIEQAQEKKEQIQVSEDRLADLKEEHRRLIEETLPAAMQQCGLDTFGAADLGIDVELENKVDCKIPEKYPSAAFTWLKEHGYGDIIKNEVVVSFGAGEEEKAAEFYEGVDYPAARKMNVHPSTLKAFIKSMLEEGKELPLEYFGVFQRTVAKIKPRK